jgi:hypothetical protein
VSSSADRVAAIALALAVVLLAALWIPATLRDPGLTHGDHYSDANVLIAGRNFDIHGLAFRNGLPVQYTCLPAGHVPEPYTHYPPGPEWLHQGMKALGLRTLAGFRLAALAVSLAGALLQGRLYSVLSGSLAIGGLSTLLYMLSPGFLSYADSLQQFAYRQITLPAILLAWLRVEAAAPGRGRWRWTAVTGGMYFLDGWISFEQILLVAAFVCGRVLLQRRRDLVPSLLVLLAVPALLMSARVAHNASVLGLRATIADLAQLDTMDSVAPSRVDVARTWMGRLGAGDAEDEREFELPLLRPAVALPLAALALALARAWRGPTIDPVRRGIAAALLLLLAALPWFVVFPTHGLVHPHLVMLLLPGFALAAGSLASLPLHLAGPPALRAVTGLLSVALVAGFTAIVMHRVPFARLLVLDEGAGAIMKDRRRTRDQYLAASEALRARRCVVLLGNYPYIAQALAAPSQPAVVRTRTWDTAVPDLAPDESLWIEAWSEAERGAAAAAAARYGLPDLLAPERVSLVFHGTPPVTRTIDADLGGGASLRRLRVSRTLSGEDIVVMVEVAGPRAEATALVLRGHLVDAQGDGDSVGEFGFGSGYTSHDRSLGWLTVPVERAAASPGLRLSVWDRTRSEPRASFSVPLEATR